MYVMENKQKNFRVVPICICLHTYIVLSNIKETHHNYIYLVVPGES